MLNFRLGLLLLFCFFASPSLAQPPENQYVVILSLDGFRADYMDKYDAKHLKKLASRGVRIKRLIPSNPTKTFPNHYTLVTGLYPDHHGLVNNRFYAPDLSLTYTLSNRKRVENGDFYGGEPIWRTAQKAGLKTASYFWVGSEAPIGGKHPDIWKKYNSKITFPQKIDSVLSWLNLPTNQRPRLITFYHHEPDHSGHRYGPNSPEVKAQVLYLDSLIGKLYHKLMQLPIAEKINLIIISDHGMRTISEDKVIVLSNQLKADWVEHLNGSNPVYSIFSHKGKSDSVYRALKKVAHLRLFRRGKVPKKYHFGSNNRCGDLILVAKKGWSIYPKPQKNYTDGGTHGYLNTDPQMAALFVGIGPRFKQGITRKRLKNTEIYNLLATLLGIAPAPNDGNIKQIKKLLKK